MLATGMPGFFQRPLEFLLAEELTPDEEEVVTVIERTEGTYHDFSPFAGYWARGKPKSNS